MKKKLKLGVYAGSFDPLTIGHVWMIEQGVRVFDELVVAIGINPDKKYKFSLEERLEMLRASTRKFSNLRIDSYHDQFLINYAQSIQANYILRGIRSESDYEYERAMRNINGDLNASITTVFLMPPRTIAEISSSMVKGLIGPAGWERIVKDYVPAPVYKKLLQQAHAKPREK